MSGRQPSSDAHPSPADARHGAASGRDHEVHSVDIASALAEVAPRGGLRGLYDRFGHLLHELGKFGTVGMFAFVVDAAVFNVLRSRHVESLTSATISMAIAATVAFIGNRFWTWRDRERSGLRREYTLYFMFNAGGLLIALACLAISTYGLGSIWPVFTTPIAENISKQIIGTALGTAFRFWAYRNIVFRASAGGGAEPAVEVRDMGGTAS